jgi:hypothetical protein
MPANNNKRKKGLSTEVSTEWDFYSIAKTMLMVAGGVLIFAFVYVVTSGLIAQPMPQSRVLNDRRSARTLSDDLMRRSNLENYSYPYSTRVNFQTANNQLGPFIENDGNNGLYIGWEGQQNPTAGSYLQQFDEYNNPLLASELEIETPVHNEINQRGTLTTENKLAYVFATQPPSANLLLMPFASGPSQLLNVNGYPQSQSADNSATNSESVHREAPRNDGGFDMVFLAGSPYPVPAVRRFKPLAPGYPPVVTMDTTAKLLSTAAFNNYLNYHIDVTLGADNIAAAVWERAANSTALHEVVVRGYNSSTTPITFLDPLEIKISPNGYDCRISQTGTSITGTSSGYMVGMICANPLTDTYYTPSEQLLNSDRTQNGPLILLNPLQMATTSGFSMALGPDSVFVTASSSHASGPGIAGFTYVKRIFFNGSVVSDLWQLDPSNTQYSETMPDCVYTQTGLENVYQKDLGALSTQQDIFRSTIYAVPVIKISNATLLENGSSISLPILLGRMFNSPTNINVTVHIPPGTGALAMDTVSGTTIPFNSQTGDIMVTAQSESAWNDFNTAGNSLTYTPASYYNGIVPVYVSGFVDGAAVNAAASINVTAVYYPTPSPRQSARPSATPAAQAASHPSANIMDNHYFQTFLGFLGTSIAGYLGNKYIKRDYSRDHEDPFANRVRAIAALEINKFIGGKGNKFIILVEDLLKLISPVEGGNLKAKLKLFIKNKHSWYADFSTRHYPFYLLRSEIEKEVDAIAQAFAKVFEEGEVIEGSGNNIRISYITRSGWCDSKITFDTERAANDIAKLAPRIAAYLPALVANQEDDIEMNVVGDVKGEVTETSSSGWGSCLPSFTGLFVKTKENEEDLSNRPLCPLLKSSAVKKK